MAYTPEEIQKAKELIIEGISNGKSLKSILDKNNKLPVRQTVYNWLNSFHTDYDESFLDNYVRAREESADLDAENIQDVAEKTLNGTYEPNAARVAIDAYKWNAAKKQPKKYGDRIQNDVNLTMEQPLFDDSKGV